MFCDPRQRQRRATKKRIKAELLAERAQAGRFLEFLYEMTDSDLRLFLETTSYWAEGTLLYLYPDGANDFQDNMDRFLRRDLVGGRTSRIQTAALVAYRKRCIADGLYKDGSVADSPDDKTRVVGKRRSFSSPKNKNNPHDRQYQERQ